MSRARSAIRKGIEAPLRGAAALLIAGLTLSLIPPSAAEAVTGAILPDFTPEQVGTWTTTASIPRPDPYNPDTWVQQWDTAVSPARVDPEAPVTIKIFSSSTTYWKREANVSFCQSGTTADNLSEPSTGRVRPVLRNGYDLVAAQGTAQLPDSDTAHVVVTDQVYQRSSVICGVGPAPDIVESVDQIVYSTEIQPGDPEYPTETGCYYIGPAVNNSVANLAETNNQPFQAEGTWPSIFVGPPSASDECSTDIDGDGVPDSEDNCPETPNNDQQDTDSDGMGDACDVDDDNDGTPDSEDDLPLDPTETKDFDGDGIGNNADPDDDNDGVLDEDDACPLLAGTVANGGCPECDILQTTSATWDARVVLPLAPDQHTFLLTVDVEACTDGASYAEITGVNATTSIDEDVFDFFWEGLGLFGFEPEWVGDADVDDGPPTGTWHVGARAAVCWDFKDVIDRFKIGKLAKAKLEKKMETTINKLAKKYGGFESFEAREAFLDDVGSWLGDDVDDKGLDNIDQKLKKVGVPVALADEIEDIIQGIVGAIADSYAEKLRERLATEITGQELYDFFDDEFLDPIFDFGQICNALTVWEPHVVVAPGVAGPTMTLNNTYLHWAFETELVD